MAAAAVGRAGARPRAGVRAPATPFASGWAWAIGFLVLVIWLIPIRSYRLPVALPFNLELYRLVIIALLFGWMLTALRGRVELGAGGLGLPLVILGAGATAAVLVNRKTITGEGLETQSVKSLSYLLSFLIAFVLVYSTIRTFRDVEFVVGAVVFGAVLVGIAALIEQRTKYNFFNHLHPLLPFLEQTKDVASKVRFGRLRVTASAQHPIALGVALVMVVPLAFYLARNATSRNWRRVWWGACFVLCAAALATESRTVVTVIIAMTGRRALAAAAGAAPDVAADPGAAPRRPLRGAALALGALPRARAEGRDRGAAAAAGGGAGVGAARRHPAGAEAVGGERPRRAGPGHRAGARRRAGAGGERRHADHLRRPVPARARRGRDDRVRRAALVRVGDVAQDGPGVEARRTGRRATCSSPRRRRAPATRWGCSRSTRSRSCR